MKKSLDGLYVCADYGENQVLQKAIHACKYFGKKRLISRVCRRFCEVGSLIEGLLGIDKASSMSCVPVPLARVRLRERGFNQAEELAKVIAQKLSVPLVTTVLERTRNTPPQAKLGRRERLKNLQGAFRCTAQAPEQVLLIDDVSTTLATLEHCAEALRKSGAKFVYGLVLARSGRAR